MGSQTVEHVNGLAWSAWGALGAGTWGTAHSGWSIDPEALLLLTGSIDGRDPRLEQESLRWVATNHDLLSRTRLGRLLDTWPSTPQWADYATRLEAVTGKPWPGAGVGSRSREAIERGERRLSRQLVLRLRAGIGVGVRSELVRILLLGTVPLPATASHLAQEAGYGKRSVAAAAEQMAATGLLAGIARGNTIGYQLTDPDSWASVFGPLPEIRLSFLSICRAATILSRGVETVDGLEQLADDGEIVRIVAARKSLQQAQTDLANLGIRPPDLSLGSDTPQQYAHFVDETLARLVRGQTP